MSNPGAERIHRSRVIVGVGGALCCLTLVSGCRLSTGLSDGSDAAAAPLTPIQIVAHGKPEGVSVTANGLRSAVLSWSQPIEQVFRYRVERAELLEGPYVWVADVSPDRLTYTDGLAPETRLKDSATYYYRLSALIDKTGVASEPTPPVKTVTAPPPVPPASVKAEATGSRAVTVSWPLSASEGVTTYRVERTPVEQPDAYAKVGEVREPTFVDGGTPASTLKDSSAYFYRVVSVNRVASESVPSAPVKVLTLPPPAAPLKPAAVSDEVRCVPLTWQASPESDVIRYDIYQARAAEGPFVKIGEVTGRTVTQYTDGGGNPGSLEDEGTYFYRVRAVNGVTAESADSETVRALTRAVPPEVQQVTTVSARPREVPVSWVASPDTAVVGYEVWRSTAGADDWAQIARLSRRDITSFLDRGGEKDNTQLGLLTDGTEYQYKVIAFNTGSVRSSASGSVLAKTKVIPVPPAGLVVTTNLALAVRLTWKPNPERDVNGYLIESSKRPEDGFRKLAVVHADGGAALTTDELDLAPAQIRYYRVKALDKEGLESAWSEVAEGRSKALPDAPEALAAQPDGGAIRLTWQPSKQADVTQYKVWIKKMFGWDLVASTDAPEYRLELADRTKAVSVAVSAVDKDKQESGKSAALKVDPKAP